MLFANDISRKSWIKYNNLKTDFPIQNIPFGAFKTKNSSHHIGTRIGDTIISITELERCGYFKKLNLDKNTFQTKNLNKFLKQKKSTWREVRNRIAYLFDLNNKSKIIFDDLKKIIFKKNNIQMVMPIKIGDYTDFYSSKNHATNVGKMFRDPENALLPNWLHIPVGYHGRSSSIVISGTPIKRPKGQIIPKNQKNPIFSESKLLDFELEMAFITGQGKKIGDSISTKEAEEYIFGLCLFNDWSARDIQKWEYVPLGPFLGKNFSSSISPWIVTLDALEPFKIPGEKQHPEVLKYLQFKGKKSYNISLEIFIKSKKSKETKISESNFKYMYWNMCQQLAHHTINGCNINAGDVMASGTISGKSPSEYGSMLELSWAGTRTIKLENGEERKFIKNDDTVIMTAYSIKNNIRIGFGKLSNTVIK